MLSTVPDIEWPENFGPNQGDEIVAKIMSLLAVCLTDRSVIVFVPDPPQSANSLSWIIEQCDEELQLTSLSWGKRGLAYVADQSHYFKSLIAVFLAMGSTTLSIFALEKKHSPKSISNLIDDFISGKDIAASHFPFVGLFFDMGVLMAVTQKPST
jgi:hypothetical protein